jgi:hypothetical protein
LRSLKETSSKKFCYVIETGDCGKKIEFGPYIINKITRNPLKQSSFAIRNKRDA